MAYSFDSGNTQRIVTGTPIGGGTWSIFARFRINAANALERTLIELWNGVAQVNACLEFNSGGSNNQVRIFCSTGGAAQYPVLEWVSGFAAGSLHTLLATYDATNFRIYADTDATAKATGSSGTPASSDSTMTEVVLGHGDGGAGGRPSLDGILYEAAWWPGTVLTGAQSALLGLGYSPLYLVPRPANYWRLIADAKDEVGGLTGTVTGATLVPHNAPVLYGAPPALFRFVESIGASIILDHDGLIFHRAATRRLITA